VGEEEIEGNEVLALAETVIDLGSWRELEMVLESSAEEVEKEAKVGESARARQVE
jgi:hypothetical protein